jgi:Zn-dependent M28 family amino/carboxypeptidase
MAEPPRFSDEAERFMRVGGDRLVALAGILSSSGLRYSVVKIGEARHLLARIGKGRPSLVLVAHYDRAPGSAGALDNSCACLQLAAFAARLASPGPRSPGETCPPLLFAFTDAEEAPGAGEASSQGSYALARNIKAAGGAGEGMAALVFDVTGRGDRLLLSTAPVDLLARNGLGGSPVAEGHRSLVALARRAAARARIREPLGAALPWSDDLGLTLGGLPALTLSLLPEAEASLLGAGKRPPTWDLLHTADDTSDRAEGVAFDIMAAFLDALSHELVPGR